MSDILQQIQARIAGVSASPQRRVVGTVREIGDGVARLEGLDSVMSSEMLDFGHDTIGLAMNLEETEVGAIVLGNYGAIREGDEVRATGRLLQVPVGRGLRPEREVRYRGHDGRPAHAGHGHDVR